MSKEKIGGLPISCDFAKKDYREASEKILDRLNKQNTETINWIATKDEMPPNNVKCVFADIVKGEMNMGAIEDHDIDCVSCQCGEGFVGMVNKYTHWARIKGPCLKFS